MNERAIDLVSEIPDYERPFFDFPELSSPDGNPHRYWKKAIISLWESGFKKEASDILKYDSSDHSKGSFSPKKELQEVSPYVIVVPKIPYYEQFDFLAKYLDFLPLSENRYEEDGYVCVKTEKRHNPKQVPEFLKSDDKKFIEKMISDGFDFSSQNCYGRIFANYVENSEALNLLLSENSKLGLFDLFHIDNFGGTILHSQTDSSNIAAIFSKMAEENIEMAKICFLGNDVFGRSPADLFLKSLDEAFTRFSKNGFIDDRIFDEIVKNMSAVKTAFPGMALQVASMMKEFPIFKTGNGEVDDEAFAKYYKKIINSVLDEKESPIASQKRKI